MKLCVSLLAIALVACEQRGALPPVDPDSAAVERLAGPGARLAGVLDRIEGRTLFAAARAPRSETDVGGEATLLEASASGTTVLARRVRAARYAPDGAVLAVRDGALVEIKDGSERLVARDAAADFALDPAGSRVVLVRRKDPRRHHTSIDLLERDGRLVRTLAAPSAVTQLPIFGPGDRFVVYSSGRSGIQSLYRVGIDGASERQLTNVGLTVPGGARDPRFVPPPNTRVGMRFVDDRTLVYDAGDAFWTVDVETGAGRRWEGRP